MESKVVVVSIIVRDEEAAAAVNDLLHEYRQYIVGRMGIPYRQRNVSIISVVMDAPGEVASALSGKLGMQPGVTAKTLTATKYRIILDISSSPSIPITSLAKMYAERKPARSSVLSALPRKLRALSVSTLQARKNILYVLHVKTVCRSTNLYRKKWFRSVTS